MSCGNSDLWLNIDEVVEIVQAYERIAKLTPDDTQMHFDYGLAFNDIDILAALTHAFLLLGR